jgi:hypothetical protein
LVSRKWIWPREKAPPPRVFRKGVLSSGDDQLIKILKLLPEESYGRLARMFEDNK